MFSQFSRLLAEPTGRYRIPSCRIKSKVEVGLISVPTLGDAEAECPRTRRGASIQGTRWVVRTAIKVSNCGKFTFVMFCRSSIRLAFLKSESGQCSDLSITTARNIAITPVKASPTESSLSQEGVFRGL